MGIESESGVSRDEASVSWEGKGQRCRLQCPCCRLQCTSGPRIQRSLSIDASSAQVSAAFMDVVNGKVPNDRIALRVLAKEMEEWPLIKEGRSPATVVRVMVGRAMAGVTSPQP